MPQTFQSSTLGALFALVTAFMWGVLPIFLKLLLVDSDAYTITAVRFIFAGAVVLSIVLFNAKLPRIKGHGWSIWSLLLLGTVFLLINYVTNVLALEYISPSTVQLVMQLAPFLLIVGGIALYNESLSRPQLAGAIILFTGMAFFFNQRIPVIISSETERIEGVFIVVVSATAWAVYALTQKRLFSAFTSQQLTLFIYLLGGLILFPFSDLDSLFTFNSVQWFALLFCCVNTLVAYGAFTHAMQIWDASKVSAIISISPVFTYLSNKMAVALAPELFYEEQLNWAAYLGAFFIIGGAMLAALGKQSTRNSTADK